MEDEVSELPKYAGVDLNGGVAVGRQEDIDAYILRDRRERALSVALGINGGAAVNVTSLIEAARAVEAYLKGG
jgi:hypothetical protein